MDLARVRREVSEAQQHFSYVECHPSSTGSLYVLAALQTSLRMYTLAVEFPDAYPNQPPNVFIRKPEISRTTQHWYKAGNICYMLPSLWNPGAHNLTFVLAKAAKWLNKYEIYSATGRWPGAEIKH